MGEKITDIRFYCQVFIFLKKIQIKRKLVKVYYSHTGEQNKPLNYSLLFALLIIQKQFKCPTRKAEYINLML